MDKKELYEHLAQIYLDASTKKEKKKPKKSYFFKRLNLFFSIFGFIVLFALGAQILLSLCPRNIPSSKSVLKEEFSLVIQPAIVKINFNFDPVKKEIYTINLNKLDLRRFKHLGFLIRKANFNDQINLKVEFSNTFKETSEIYLSDINSFRWQEYILPLSDFKNITNWSEMTNLSFIVEESNVKGKQGILYIDNVRLLR